MNSLKITKNAKFNTNQVAKSQLNVAFVVLLGDFVELGIGEEAWLVFCEERSGNVQRIDKKWVPSIKWLAVKRAGCGQYLANSKVSSLFELTLPADSRPSPWCRALCRTRSISSGWWSATPRPVPRWMGENEFLVHGYSIVGLIWGELLQHTWFVTGLMRQLANKRSICWLLKLDTPMLFTKPKSTSSSMAFQVSK